MSDCGSRCTGHCCQKFCLPVSPMQFENMKRRLAKGLKLTVDRGNHANTWDAKEITKIANMVIFVREGQDFSFNRGISTRNQDFKRDADNMRRYFYNCKHYNYAEQVCNNYSDRPSMCRDFPNGRKCHIKACTMKRPVEPLALKQKAKKCPPLLNSTKELASSRSASAPSA